MHGIINEHQLFLSILNGDVVPSVLVLIPKIMSPPSGFGGMDLSICYNHVTPSGFGGIELLICYNHVTLSGFRKGSEVQVLIAKV